MAEGNVLHPTMYPSYRIISLHITHIAYQEALQQLLAIARLRKPSYACFANGHMTIEAWYSQALAEYVNHATYVFADGKALGFALRLLYRVPQERIAGMDVMPDLIALCEKEQLPIFLFGGSPQALDLVQSEIRTRHPHAIIAGACSPPYRIWQKEENAAYIQRINQSGAAIVFVALGCPKQEIWMAQHSQHIHGVLLGVGGAFPVYARLQKRAPRWMQHLALEWLFRLAQEPRRLFKRFLIANILFLTLFTKEWFAQKLLTRRNRFIP